VIGTLAVDGWAVTFGTVRRVQVPPCCTTDLPEQAEDTLKRLLNKLLIDVLSFMHSTA